MLILDTDHVSLLEWEHGDDYQRLRTPLDQASHEIVATTIVSYEEQTRGWLAYMAKAKTLEQQIKAYERLHRHLNTYAAIRVMDFDEPAAVEYRAIEHLKQKTGVYDLRIAAIAKCLGATLISRNARHFNLVPGLVVEDWTRV